MLDELRQEIRDIDGRIAELVAERLDLARRIGREKERLGLTVRDYGVEKAVLARARRRAGELGIDAALLKDIALTLIRGAVGLQVSERRTAPVATGDVCAIIGGGGKMGGWFDRFTASLGYRTRVIEPGDPLDTVAEAELVVVAVPLAAMRPVLEQVLDLQPRGIVLEIASLKSHLVDLVQAGIDRGLQVVALHPMFGPDKDLLAGQNVVVCRAGCPDAEDKAIALFADTAAVLTEIPLVEHDRYMTWVLNLPHLINLTVGDVLRHCGLTYSDLQAFGGTTFNQQLRVTDEVMNENPELYYHIQHLNRHRDDLFAAIRGSLDRLAELSADDDPGDFTALMSAWRPFKEAVDD